MYTVIGAAQNRTFRVIWMLEEIGEAYDRIRAKQHTPEILKYTPIGKMPVLVEDGEAISDSAAILTYLADKHGKLTAPAGTIARAKRHPRSAPSSAPAQQVDGMRNRGGPSGSICDLQRTMVTLHILA